MALFKRRSGPRGRTAAIPQRSRQHSLLGWRVTAQAVFGLTALALAISALLAIALWLVLAPADIGLSLPWRILIAITAVAAAALLLHWLWLPPSEAPGVAVTRGELPALFEVLDRHCAALGIEPLDHVLIGSDMNASVVQLPELGLWGRLRTTLVVGMPLLLSVSPLQFEAILAHELSHLALQRRTAGAWAAQLRAWWHRVLLGIDDNGSVPARMAAVVLSHHASSYLFDAVRLTHLEEFEADQCAAALVGPESLAEALVEVAQKERFMREEYWDAVMTQFEYPGAGEPILPFRTMAAGLSLGYHRTEMAGNMGELFDHAQSLELHPRLIERLAALQVGPLSVVTEGPSAADRYLGAVASKLACRLDRAWCMALAPCCR